MRPLSNQAAPPPQTATTPIKPTERTSPATGVAMERAASAMEVARGTAAETANAGTAIGTAAGTTTVAVVAPPTRPGHRAARQAVTEAVGAAAGAVTEIVLMTDTRAATETEMATITAAVEGEEGKAARGPGRPAADFIAHATTAVTTATVAIGETRIAVAAGGPLARIGETTANPPRPSSPRMRGIVGPCLCSSLLRGLELETSRSSSRRWAPCPRLRS